MATINDIVLLHLEDSPVSFARVESILPDHKKDWFQIKLLMLQIPLQVVTWILKDDYINGEDFFMDGKKMRLDVVECPPEELATGMVEKMPIKKDTSLKTVSLERSTEKSTEKPDNNSQGKKGQLISFSDLKKKDNGSKPDTDTPPEIG